MGAGGIGSYVGAVLSRAGHDVGLVARGAHALAVRERGLEVEDGEDGFVAHPTCLEADEVPDGVDAVLVAVKAYSLDEVAPQLVRLSEGGALVVPLLNGIDTSERLAAAGVPPDRIVDGVAYMTAFRTAPGEIARRGEHQRLVIGSATGASTHRLEDVVRIFQGSPIEVLIADDIRIELWRKMAVVCALAAICGITGAALGPIRAHPLGRSLQKRAIGEVMAVGRSRGVPLPCDAEARVGEILDAFPDDFYPSVLHDLKSGRRTEMDALGGTLTRLGREAGVETPLFDAATCAVAVVEGRDAADR